MVDQKKGFTLIELLAVIVILVIIALIATPMILGVIDKSRKKALEDSGYGLIESAGVYYIEKKMEEDIKKTEFIFTNGEQTSEQRLNYKGKIDKGNVKLYSDGKVALCISDGKNVAIKNVDEDRIKMTTGSCNYNSVTDSYETVEVCDLELKQLKEQGNATADQILSGKTAIVKGKLITGTLEMGMNTDSGRLIAFWQSSTRQSYADMSLVIYNPDIVTQTGNRVITKYKGVYRYYITCGTSGLDGGANTFNLYTRIMNGSTVVAQTSGKYSYNKTLGDYTFNQNSTIYPQTYNSSKGSASCGVLLYQVS